MGHTYVVINGKVYSDIDKKAIWHKHKIFLYKYRYVLGFLLIMICSWCMQEDRSNEASNGQIPARKRNYTQHWNYIRKWKTFTRDLSQHGNGEGSKRAGLSTLVWGVYGGHNAAKKNKFKDYGAEDDSRLFGGMDGHEPEDIDFGASRYSPSVDVKKIKSSLAVTRCATTRFAVTVYFCGVAIARNMDHNLSHEEHWNRMMTKPFGIGSPSLIHFLKNWNEKQNEDGDRELVVLRLGVSQKERSKPPQEHVWSIVCNPDGRCHWYQSYISEYSLFDWMDFVGEKSLSLSEVTNRLAKIGQLGKTKKWNYNANTLYKELFWVDIIGNDNEASSKFDYTKHQLTLHWNVAC